MATLKALDIGYGYTFDGGKTFPFRGKGIGMMPTLTEVFDALPEGRFLVNFKSRRKEEGDALAALLKTSPAYRSQVIGVYGGSEPTEATMAQVTGLPGFSNASTKSCLLQYLALGWSSYVPKSCRNRLVAVPANYAFLLWGWPTRFYDRIRSNGSDVIIMGTYEAGDAGTSGIDDAAAKSRIPDAFPGYIWTNKILSWKVGGLLRDERLDEIWACRDVLHGSIGRQPMPLLQPIRRQAHSLPGRGQSYGSERWLRSAFRRSDC